MKQFIYADNAATTRLSEEALDAMLPWLRNEYANASQPYAFARKPKKALVEAREIIAQSIGAEPNEIYFTSCGTESNNWVVQRALSDCTYKHIVTSAIEHHAILNVCQQMKDMQGAEVTLLQVNAEGIVTTPSLEKSLTASHGLVSIMMANNEIGTIQPIHDLAEIAHKKGYLFHTDAVQAVGHIPIDVKELGVDFLSASAHKFNGPKGIGFLYIRKGISLSSLLAGGAQESGLRAGTENIAGVVGMATALKENIRCLCSNQKYILELEAKLIQLLDDSGLTYKRNGSENHLPGVISLSFPGHDGEAILHRLDLLGICISTGSACDSKNTQISHVLKAIGADTESAKGTIRISLGKSNSITDVESIADALKRIIL